MRKFAYLPSQNLKDMRKLFTLIAAVAALMSCNNVRHDFVNETYSENEDSLIIRCSSLRGLGPLIIGDTNPSDISPLKLNYSYKSEGFLVSHWLSANSELASVLNATPNIECIKLGKLKIGEIEIGDVDLAFYDDRLVAIAFRNGTLLKHYLSKYGNGIGRKYVNNFIYEDYTKDRYHHEEEHLWYNNSVQMTYTHRYKNERAFVAVSNEFVISDRAGQYDAFLSDIKKAKEAHYKAEQRRKTESLNIL